jgi:hypothetical protein
LGFICQAQSQNFSQVLFFAVPHVIYSDFERYQISDPFLNDFFQSSDKREIAILFIRKILLIVLFVLWRRWLAVEVKAWELEAELLDFGVLSFVSEDLLQEVQEEICQLDFLKDTMRRTLQVDGSDEGKGFFLLQKVIHFRFPDGLIFVLNWGWTCGYIIFLGQ